MKMILSILLLLLSGLPVMADQPDAMMIQEYSGNTQVKTSSAKVYGLQTTYIGATAGDFIQLIDGSTSSSTVRFRCVASSSSGTCQSPLTVAMYFGTGVLYTEQKSTGASFKTYIQYF